MKPLLLLFIVTLGVGCNNKPVREPSNGMADARKEILATDAAFSDLSRDKGMKAAFIEYIDSNGVLLRPGSMPIMGANAIDYLIQQNDTAYTMEWKPSHAEVSKSLDMGYSYGIYAIKPSIQDTILYGTYVSIWKKQGDGSWKFVLDSGNEGIGEIN